MITVLDRINISELLIEYKKLNSDIHWFEFGHKGKQTGLQFKDNEDPWTSAVGRSKGDELSYTSINPFFKGTLFEGIIEKYSLKRTRLMWCSSYSCYSIHKDETPRIHIPLITDPSCYFLFPPTELTFMAPGFVYKADTRKLHTFINCSENDRLHLVGAIDA